MLPTAHEAAAWYLDVARATLDAGGSLDVDAVLALRELAPGDPLVAEAVERLDAALPGPPAEGLLARAQDTAAAFAIAVESQDQTRARQIVDDLETDLLAAFRPGQSLGSVEADVAIASLLLDFWDLGRQLPHAMMAEELMRIMLRVHWDGQPELPFAARAEAARTLLRLHRSPQSRPEYYDHGIAILHDLAGCYRQQGFRAAPYVRALQLIS